MEGAQKAAPEVSAEETAVELVIKTVEAKIRRWEETLENGLLSLKECAARIKELRGQREDLLSRKAALQKQTRRRAKVLPIPTGLMDRYIEEVRLRLRQKKIGYKKEFLREILKEVRVRGKEVRLTYRLPMTVRTPLSKGETPQKEEFSLYQLVELMGVEPTTS